MRVAALAILLLLLGAFVLIVKHAAGNKYSHSLRVRMKSPLPALKVIDRDGKAIDLSLVGQGHLRVIAFFSPDCHACQRTLPELDPFPRQLMLIMVSEHDIAEIPKDELPFLPSGLYFDRNKVLNSAVSLPSLPTILFVDRSGILQDAIVGLHDRAAVQTELTSFASPGR